MEVRLNKMSKKTVCLLLSVIVLIVVLFLSGCNRQIIDTTYSFGSAIIAMPDGSTVSGRVEYWKDYSDSDAVQVKIDGKVYYTFLGNVILIK